MKLSSFSLIFLVQLTFHFTPSQGGYVGQNVVQSNSLSGGTSTNMMSTGDSSITINRRMGQEKEYIEYLSVSNPQIRIDGDYFSCASLTCPKSAFKCEVVSEAIPDDPHNMKTTAECFDKDNTSLERKEFVEANPHPEAKPFFSRHAIVDKDGAMAIEDSIGNNLFSSQKLLTKEEQENLLRAIEEQNHKINHQIHQQNQHFQQQMQQFQQQMQQTFGNGFPFGNAYAYNYIQPYAYQFPYFPFNYYNNNNNNNNNPNPQHYYNPTATNQNYYYHHYR